MRFCKNIFSSNFDKKRTSWNFVNMKFKDSQLTYNFVAFLFFAYFCIVQYLCTLLSWFVSYFNLNMNECRCDHRGCRKTLMSDHAMEFSKPKAHKKGNILPQNFKKNVLNKTSGEKLPKNATFNHPASLWRKR